MRIVERMKDKMREGIRSFLQIQPATGQMITIQEGMDYHANAIKNRVWYRGDSNELNQLYHQLNITGLNAFWAAVPTVGREIRKIHTGLPGIIVDTLVNIILTEFNSIDLEDKYKKDWERIAKENNIKKLLENMIKDSLIVGDGAIKLSLDTDISMYPIIEWVPGDRVELKYEYGRFKEAIFKTFYTVNAKKYCLHEIYGFGYIDYKLYKGEKEVGLSAIPETQKLRTIEYDGDFCMAKPFSIFSSDKYEGRGRSIFDNKCDDFDALDESWSQWMQALRDGRSRTYVPEDLLPRNPNTGKILAPNAFDNQYIQTDSPASEKSEVKIDVEQPAIPHDSYCATYVTALDLCLQGVISPSTIGIDVKKMDNAESQREKEKTTLYTRGKIIDALQDTIPDVVNVVFKVLATLNGSVPEDIESTINFGDYANPSFESQIETIGKAKQYEIMSNEAVVEELYGDTKDEDWKKEEVERLNRNDGYEAEEKSVADDEDFEIKYNT